jgi:hypothetical protein
MTLFTKISTLSTANFSSDFSLDSDDKFILDSSLPSNYCVSLVREMRCYSEFDDLFSDIQDDFHLAYLNNPTMMTQLYNDSRVYDLPNPIKALILLLSDVKTIEDVFYHFEYPSGALIPPNFKFPGTIWSSNEIEFVQFRTFLFQMIFLDSDLRIIDETECFAPCPPISSGILLACCPSYVPINAKIQIPYTKICVELPIEFRSEIDTYDLENSTVEEDEQKFLSLLDHIKETQPSVPEQYLIMSTRLPLEAQTNKNKMLIYTRFLNDTRSRGFPDFREFVDRRKTFKIYSEFFAKRPDSHDQQLDVIRWILRSDCIGITEDSRENLSLPYPFPDYGMLQRYYAKEEHTCDPITQHPQSRLVLDLVLQPKTYLLRMIDTKFAKQYNLSHSLRNSPLAIPLALIRHFLYEGSFDYESFPSFYYKFLLQNDSFYSAGRPYLLCLPDAGREVIIESMGYEINSNLNPPSSPKSNSSHLDDIEIQFDPSVGFFDENAHSGSGFIGNQEDWEKSTLHYGDDWEEEDWSEDSYFDPDDYEHDLQFAYGEGMMSVISLEEIPEFSSFHVIPDPNLDFYRHGSSSSDDELISIESLPYSYSDRDAVNDFRDYDRHLSECLSTSDFYSSSSSDDNDPG